MVVGVVATVEVVLVSVSFVIAVSVRATVDGAHAAAAVAIILLETVAADLFVADDVYRAKDWPFLPSSIAFCSHSASAILRLSPYFLRFQWPFALRFVTLLWSAASFLACSMSFTFNPMTFWTYPRASLNDPTSKSRLPTHPQSHSTPEVYRTAALNCPLVEALAQQIARRKGRHISHLSNRHHHQRTNQNSIPRTKPVLNSFGVYVDHMRHQLHRIDERTWWCLRSLLYYPSPWMRRAAVLRPNSSIRWSGCSLNFLNWLPMTWL